MKDESFAQSVFYWIVTGVILYCLCLAFNYRNTINTTHNILSYVTGSYRVDIKNNSSDYDLTISNFKGNVDELNTIIFNQLKGKEGCLCNVYLRIKEKNQYGKEISKMYSIARIRLDELNKYTDAEYWSRAFGVKYSSLFSNSPYQDNYNNNDNNGFVPIQDTTSTYESYDKPVPVQDTTSTYETTASTNNQTSSDDTFNRSYELKYTYDSNGDIHYNTASIYILSDKIIYIKNGNRKEFSSIDEGDYIDNSNPPASFKYRKFYLNVNGKYLYVSYKKIQKYNEVFYYHIILDNELSLAL